MDADVGDGGVVVLWLCGGHQCHGLEQYAMRQFAESLEVIPRTLAENSGQDAAHTVTTLYAEHEKGNTAVGVDIEVGRSDSQGAASSSRSGAGALSALALYTCHVAAGG